MQRITLYIIAALLVWMLLSQFVIMRKRWSDSKAHKAFAQKKISLSTHDTIIKVRHLHFASTGATDLPTLVFIHGSPGSWKDYAEYLWDTTLLKKYRMVSIDRPGFGYSDFGKALPLQKQCEIILPVLRSLSNEKPMYLYGHSMAAAIVVQLAGSDPTLVKALVIAAGAIDVSQEEKETWRKIIKVKPLAWLLPGVYRPSNTELLYLKSDLLPLQDQFKNITCPVHFIHGNADKRVPIENMSYGKKMLINASKVTTDTIRGGGHNIPWKNKDRIKELLLTLDQ